METKIEYSAYFSILQINKKGRATADSAFALWQFTIEGIRVVYNDLLLYCSPEGSPRQRAAH